MYGIRGVMGHMGMLLYLYNKTRSSIILEFIGLESDSDIDVGAI